MKQLKDLLTEAAALSNPVDGIVSFVFYLLFSKLNETPPRCFILVLNTEMNSLSVAQRGFVLWPRVRYWVCRGLVWNVLVGGFDNPRGGGCVRTRYWLFLNC